MRTPTKRSAIAAAVAAALLAVALGAAPAQAMPEGAIAIFPLIQPQQAAGGAVGRAIGAAAQSVTTSGTNITFGRSYSVSQADLFYIPADETRSEDAYLWAARLDIDGTLDGDLIAWVQHAEIDGVVTQDVNLFAQRITITGEVSDDVRVGCQELVVEGRIRGDLIAGAANIYIREGAVIEGSLLIGAGVIDLDGEVLGNAKIATGVLTMDGTIGGSAEVISDGGITLGDEAVIAGDLHYSGPSEIEFRQGAVRGGISFKRTEHEDTEDFSIPSGAKVVLRIFMLLAAIIAGSIIIALTKDHARRTANTIRTRPMKSLGIGFVAFICAPIVAIIALVLIITIPVSFILMLGFAIAAYVAKFYVAIWLGDLILSRGDSPGRSPIPSMLLGLVILYVVTAIPVAGTLISFLIVFLGIGALLQRRETRLETAFEAEPSEPEGLPNGFPGAPPAPSGS